MKTFTLFIAVDEISNTKHTHCSWPSQLHLLNTRWLSYVTLYSHRDIFFSLKVRAFSNKKACCSVYLDDMISVRVFKSHMCFEHPSNRDPKVLLPVLKQEK